MSSRRQSAINQSIVLAILAGLLLLGIWLLWHRYHARPAELPAPVATTSATDRIRIATWNIRQFSDRPGVDLRAIAEIIQTSQFDVLAIQEVKKNGEAVDRLLNVLGSPWRATSFSPITGNHERFVFLYRGDRLQEVGRAHFIQTADAGTFDRVPYQATFRANLFDFTLVTVHLSFTDTGRRRREAEALARFARDLAAKDHEKDIIVLGDFNEMKPGNLHYLESAGWQKLISQPTNLSSSEIFDNILVNRQYTPQWTGTSGVVRFDESQFKNNDKLAREKVSDHRPAYADFVTTSDRD